MSNCTIDKPVIDLAYAKFLSNHGGNHLLATADYYNLLKLASTTGANYRGITTLRSTNSNIAVRYIYPKPEEGKEESIADILRSQLIINEDLLRNEYKSSAYLQDRTADDGSIIKGFKEPFVNLFAYEQYLQELEFYRGIYPKEDTESMAKYEVRLRKIVDTSLKNYEQGYGFNAQNYRDLNSKSLEASSNSDQLLYTLRAIEILQSDRAKQIFDKGNKNNWTLDKILTELNIPKEQKSLISSDNKNREDIINNLVTNYNYPVEVKTAYNEEPIKSDIWDANKFKIEDTTYEWDEGYWVKYKDNDTEVTPIEKIEYNKALEKFRELKKGNPTQYYSNLIVPGGTNYTENRIITPNITPSIKGHPQFAESNDIGWFRSDEQNKEVINKLEPEPLTDWLTNGEEHIIIGSKTRRILELQSDLFQKGRDKNDLVSKAKQFKLNNNYYIIDIKRDSTIHYLKNQVRISEEEYNQAMKDAGLFKQSNSNNFLQLLNKDSAWVTFFIKSIIQDSVKKGYEKVLFPRGETAARVEGHELIAQRINKIDREIEEAKNYTVKERNLYIDHLVGKSKGKDYQVQYGDNTFFVDAENESDAREKAYPEISNYIQSLEEERARYKSEGIEKLAPIEAFYENKVTNILNKVYGKDNVKLITDEHGNSWNEITIDKHRDLQSKILLANPSTPTKDVLSSMRLDNLSLSEQTVLIDHIFRTSIYNYYVEQRHKSLFNYIQKTGGFEGHNVLITKTYNEGIHINKDKSIEVNIESLKSDYKDNKEFTTLYDYAGYRLVKTLLTINSPRNKGEQTKTYDARIEKEAKYQFNNVFTDGLYYRSTLNIDDVIEDFQREFNRQRSEAIIDDDIVDAALLKNVLNQWDKVKSLVKDKIALFDQALLHDDDNTSEDLIEDSQTETKDNKYSKDRAYNNNIQGRLKHSKQLAVLFSILPKYKTTKNPDGTFTTVVDKGMLALNKLTSTTETFTTITSLLINTPADYNVKIAKLRESATQYPFINDLINELDKADEQVKNIFTSINTVRYISMFSAFIRNDGTYKEPNYSLMNNNTNASFNYKILLKDWINYMKYANVIIDTEEGDILDKEKLTKFAEDLRGIANIEGGIKAKINVLDTTFRSIGIALHPNTLKRISEYGFDKIYLGRAKTDKEKNDLFNLLFTDTNGIFFQIARTIDEEINKEEFDNTTNPLFTSNANFGKLAKLDHKSYSNKFVTTFKNDAGKQVRSVNRPIYLSNRLRQLLNPTDTSLLTFLSNTSFSKNSIMLGKLFKGNELQVNSEFYQTLELDYIDSIKEFGEDKIDVSLNRMTKGQLEWAKITSFCSGGASRNSNKERVAKFYYPTMSDSHILAELKTIVEYIRLNDKGEVDDYNWLVDKLIVPEYNRMIEFQDPKRATLYETFNKGKDSFFMVPSLNSDRSKLLNEDGTYKQIDEVKDIFITHVKSLMTRLVNEKIKEWNKIGIIKDGNLVGIDKTYHKLLAEHTPKSVSDIQAFATDFVVNYALSKMNMFQIFIGDPAQFYNGSVAKTDLNITNRLSGDRAPYDALTGFHSPIYDTQKNLISAGRNVRIVYLKDRDDDKSSDSGAYFTRQFALDVLYAHGKITKKQYNTLLNKEVYSKADEIVFQGFKPIYYNNIMDKSNNLDRKLYIKFAATILLPQITDSFPNLKALREDMEKHNVDMSVYASGVKLGNTHAMPAFNLKNEYIGSIKDIKVDEVTGEGFGIQQEIPYEDSGRIIDPTQRAELAFLNILDVKGFKYRGKEYSGTELRKKYDEAYGKLYREIEKQVLHEIKTKDGKLDLTKIQTMLLKEAKGRGWSLSDIYNLRLNEDQTGFATPLWASTSAYKIEQFLTSIIDKRIRRLRTNGRVDLMTPSAGFVSTTSSKGKKLLNGEVVFTNKWTGNLEENQILISSLLKDSNGVLLDLLEKEDDTYKYIDEVDGQYILKSDMFTEDTLKAISVRIPTSGFNTMSPIEIVGFLPSKLGNLVVAHPSLYDRMGADNDGDELYTLLPNAKWSKTKEGISTYNIVDSNNLSDDELKRRWKQYTSNYIEEDIKTLISDNSKLYDQLDDTLININNQTKAIGVNLNSKLDFYKLSLDTVTKERDDLLNTIAEIESTDNDNDFLTSIFSTIKVEGYTAKLKKLNKDIDSYTKEIESTSKLITKQGEILKDVSLTKAIKTLGKSVDDINNQLKDNHKRINEARNNVITLDDYKQKDFTTIKDLQNEIFDISYSILTNESSEVQDQINRPMSYGILEDENYGMKNIANARAKAGNRSVFSPLSEHRDSLTYVNNQDATGIAIGINANNNIFLAKIQAVPEIEYMKDSNGDRVTLNLNGKQSTTLNSKYCVDDKTFKSNIIDAYLQASVDNNKQQILPNINFNQHTADYARMLTFMGFKEEIQLLLSQPILFDYVEYLENTGLDKPSTKRAAEAIAEKYGIDKELIGTKFDDLNDLTLDKLMTMISTPSEDHKADQVNIFLNFLYLKEIGYQLGRIQQDTAIHSKGIGASIIESSYKQSRLMGLYHNAYLDNADKIIGDIFTQADIDDGKITLDDREVYKIGMSGDKEMFARPSTLAGHSAIVALTLNNSLWGNQFPYSHTKVQQIFNLIESISNTSDRLGSRKYADSRSHIFNNWKSYVYSSFLSNLYQKEDIYAERERLLRDTYTTKEILNNKGETVITDKVHAHYSLGSIITEIRKLGTLQDNEFFDALRVIEPKEGSRVTTVEFHHSGIEALDEQWLYINFLDLYDRDTILGKFNGKDYTTKNLYKDLVAMAFINGGIQGFNEYIRFIHPAYLEEVGFNDYINSIELDNPLVTIGAYSDPYDIPAFVTQYFQHFPKEVDTTFGNKVGLTNNPNITIIDQHLIKGKVTEAGVAKFVLHLNDVTESMYETVNGEVIAPRFIVFKKTQDKVKRFQLYKYTGEQNGEAVYEKISTLGKAGSSGNPSISEYSFGKSVGESIISANRQFVTEGITHSIKKSVPNAKSVKTNLSLGQSVLLLDSNLTRAERKDVDILEDTLNHLIDNHTVNDLTAKFYTSVIANIGKLNNFKLTFNNDLKGANNDSIPAITRSVAGDISIELNLSHPRLSNPATFNKEIASILTEELVHAFTIDTIRNPKTDAERDAGNRFKALVNELDNQSNLTDNPLFKQLNSNASYRYAMSKTSVEDKALELVAAIMYDEKLRKDLSSIPYFKEDRNFLQKLYDSIVEMIKEALGIDSASAGVIYDIFNIIEEGNVSKGFQGYKGGFENTGKGTPEGDGKDKEMRGEANSVIVELADAKIPSSSRTSLKEIADNSNFKTQNQGVTWVAIGEYPGTVMLARNSRFKGMPLSPDTEQAILASHKLGGRFVVGDMPNVDSQFIDYLQEIGATFTVYHTGNESRIKVKEVNTSQLRLNLEGQDSPIDTRSIYTNTIQDDPITHSLAASAGENIAIGFTHHYETRRNSLERKLQDLNAIKRSDNLSKVMPQIEETLARKKEVDIILQDISKAAGSNEAILSLAQADLGYIDSVLSSSYTINDINYLETIITFWTNVYGIIYKQNATPELRKYLDNIVSAFRVVSNGALLDAYKLIAERDLIAQELGYNKDIVEVLPGGKGLTLLEVKELETGTDETKVDFKGRPDYRNNRIKELTLTPLKDIDWVHSWTLNITRTGNPLFQAIERRYQSVLTEADGNFHRLETTLDDLIKKAKPYVSKDWKEFKQIENGYETGDMVMLYSPSYEKILTRKAAFANKQDIGSEERSNAWKDYFQFKRDNTITLDIRKLIYKKEHYADESFNLSPEELDKYKASIIKHCGLNQFNKLMKAMEAHLATYEDNLAYAKQSIIEKFLIEKNAKAIGNLTEADKTILKEKIDKWIVLNSPYYYCAQVTKTGKPNKYSFSDESFYAAGSDGVYSVPLRTKQERNKKTGKIETVDTGFYDKNFDKIDNNEALYNLHTYFMSLNRELRQWLPSREYKELHMNTVPNIQKGILKALTGSALSKMTLATKTKLIEAITKADDPEYVSTIPDYNTNEVTKKLRTGISYDSDKVYEIVRLAKAEFISKNGVMPSTEEMSAMYVKAKDEVSRAKSWDLPQVIKAYSYLAYVYKAKADVAPYADLVKNIMHFSQQVDTTQAGVAKNVLGMETAYKPKDESYANMRKQYEYWYKGFYGQTTRESFAGSKLHYTPQEKIDKERIEQSIKDLDKRIELLNRQLEEGGKEEAEIKRINKTIDYSRELKVKLNKDLKTLGNRVYGSKVIKQFLGFVSLHGIGWNPFSPFTNMGYGFVANVTEAADGRIINERHLVKAYMQVFGNSLGIGKRIKSKTALKISALVKAHGLIHSTATELESQVGFGNNWGVLAPYAGTTATEFINQAPLLVALYYKYDKIKDIEGKEHYLFDAYDEKGHWKEVEFGDAGIWKPNVGSAWKQLHNEVIQLATGVHGDYRRLLMVRDNVVGLMIKIFRTWMFEGFANKFEREKYDGILRITRKGRYRTSLLMFPTTAKLRPGEEHSYMNNVMFNVQQLLRKFVLMKTNFDKRYTEVDAANMRKNMNELMIYMSLMMLMLLVKTFHKGEPDKEKQRYSAFLLNVMFRLHQDISFYIVPQNFEQMNKSLSPAVTTAMDIMDWFVAIGRAIGGDDDIETGTYAGESRLAVQTAKTFPIVYPIHRLRTSTIFTK